MLGPIFARPATLSALNSRCFSLITRLSGSNGAVMITSSLKQTRTYASKNLPSFSKITMPALSPTMTSGNIGAWNKKIGDEVVPGDVLVEIETDKAQMDFECQEEGFIAQILMPEGSKEVKVNYPIAILVEKKDDIAAFENYSLEDALEKAPDVPSTKTKPKKEDPVSTSAPPSSSAPPAEATSATSPPSERVIASPLAKKIAAEKGLDLSEVEGTGPNHRIVKADVEKFASSPKTASKPAKESRSSQAATPAATTAAYTDVPLSNMRKVIASRLVESKTSIPHYYLTADITMDKVLKLREVFNSQAKSQFKLSVNDFVIKAAAMSLRQVPECNSSWGVDVIRRFNNVDISVAVATPAGLITPIVTGADLRGLASISNAVRDLAARARENKLSPQEYQGGSFTISNLGMFGISEFSAIINPPQSCILAVGGTEKVVVPAPGEDGKEGFAVVSKMKVTLSCDHRVVDGAVGAQWLAKFKDYLENPLTLML